MRLRLAIPFGYFFAVLLGALLPDVGHASQLVARKTSSERLQVSKSGKALVTCHALGRLQHVLAWGAVNARRPIETEKQTAFGMDYPGGWGTFGRAACVEDASERVRSVQGAGASMARDRVNRTGRLPLGGPAVAEEPWIATDASSTSTRTTRRTGPAGGGRTVSSHAGENVVSPLRRPVG